jgi:hypothetical protein
MAGFMAGFGTKLSELIEEDRKYYRDAAAKRRDYIQTYGTRAVTERENKANAAKGVYNYLISNDISEEDARYVLNTSGVQGLAQLKATIDSRTDLTAEERSSLVKKAKNYVDENPDEDINSVLKRAYGLYKSTDNPVKRERSMFSSMLGLDSRMMEDEVLDDMYINGYSGRDIYRIMGSAEAQTGTALDLDLPTKPPSPTVLNNTAKFLESQFDTSIDSRISSVRQQMLKADPKSTDYTDLNDEVTKLENLKAKGLLALGEYAAAYDPALFDFARAQEEALPGSITRNSYLFEFLPAYQTHFEEAKDEDKLAAAGAGTPGAGEPKGDGKVDEPPKGDGVKQFATADEFNKAVDAGEVVSGDRVKVGDGVVSTFDAPPETEKGTVDLGDMSGAPGFREEPAASEEEPVDETIRSSRREKRTASESDVNVLEIISDFFTKSSTGSRGRNVNRGSAVGVSEAPVEVEELKNVLTRAVDTPAYKELQELIAEQTGMSFEEAESAIKKVIDQEPEPRFITYEDWEGMSKEKRKMFGLDVSKTKIQNITRGGLVPIPEDVVLDMGATDVQSIIRSGTLGDTRSDQADMETPRSMVVENFTTRGRNAMPSGLMSPPREFAPKLGQAEFGDLIDRVHGSSKAAEAFNNKVSSGKVTAADVTRLIKSTRKLPNTKSKDTLLQSLFDLRDALNNR